MLAALDVPHAQLFRTHDLRRGHNEDMVEAGTPLRDILIAGGWLSPHSHKSYTDMTALEMRVCHEAHASCMEDEDD